MEQTHRSDPSCDNNHLMSKSRQFKIVMLGDQGVGKTSLISRFMYDQFESNYQVPHLSSFIRITRCVCNYSPQSG